MLRMINRSLPGGGDLGSNPSPLGPSPVRLAIGRAMGAAIGAAMNSVVRGEKIEGNSSDLSRTDAVGRT